MMDKKLDIAFFGSSIVSAFWNGAATYYRGIIQALNKRGHNVTFYESDVLERQKYRDIENPDYASVIVYSCQGMDEVRAALEKARDSDIIIKASGVGAFDEFLERSIAGMKTEDNKVIFWDVDAPATLDRMQNDPADCFIELVPKYDMILTYGGGEPVVQAYLEFGARECVPVYNALDPKTHHPVAPDDSFCADLGFLGNRLPDREARVDEFFFTPARIMHQKKFLLGGSGWQKNSVAENINALGHVPTKDHNCFNCTPLAVLNISRESMARYGFSPATRVFEAAGAAACLITDHWEGIEQFLEPGSEILVAHDGGEVADILLHLSPEKAKKIGAAAMRRVLAEHTYEHRAGELELLLSQSRNIEDEKVLRPV